jgi:hypothetical protein
MVYNILKKAGASRAAPVIKPLAKKTPTKKDPELKKAAGPAKIAKKAAPKIIAVIKAGGRPKKK